MPSRKNSGGEAGGRRTGGVAGAVEKLAAPVAQSLGLSVWNVEFVKEGAAWYLRIYIDRDSGVTIDDCEAFSRAIDTILDEEDPVGPSYYLEVSSPGIERELSKDWHFQAMKGRRVRARLIRPRDGKKEIEGVLEGLEGGSVVLRGEEGRVTVAKGEASHFNLCDDDTVGDLLEADFDEAGEDDGPGDQPDGGIEKK